MSFCPVARFPPPQRRAYGTCCRPDLWCRASQFPLSPPVPISQILESIACPDAVSCCWRYLWELSGNSSLCPIAWVVCSATPWTWRTWCDDASFPRLLVMCGLLLEVVCVLGSSCFLLWPLSLWQYSLLRPHRGARCPPTGHPALWSLHAVSLRQSSATVRAPAPPLSTLMLLLLSSVTFSFYWWLAVGVPCGRVGAPGQLCSRWTYGLHHHGVRPLPFSFFSASFSKTTNTHSRILTLSPRWWLVSLLE